MVAGDYLDSPGGSVSFGVDVSEAAITISALADLVSDEAAEETVTVTLTLMALDANVQLTASTCLSHATHQAAKRGGG